MEEATTLYSRCNATVGVTRQRLLVTILLTKRTAAQNEDTLSYHRVRGLYFQAVVFVATISARMCYKLHFETPRNIYSTRKNVRPLQ